MRKAVSWTENEMLLVDIEQNMYRGLIRYPILAKQTVFYILFRLRLYERLVERISERYDDEAGFHQARIREMPMPPMMEIAKIRKYRSKDGKPTAAQKLVAFLFDGGIEHGRIYSAQEFVDSCGITRNQFDVVIYRFPVCPQGLH